MDGAPWAMPPPWVRGWERGWLGGDASAGVVVAIMLVPQSLAYAMLAGLPAQVGLLASVLPLLAYAVFGSSRALSVGPAAITSMVVGQALARSKGGDPGWLAACLALMTGALLLLMGSLRLGFLSQLLSRPVMQGFTLASAVLIVAGQVASLLGWRSLGYTLPEMGQALAQGWQAHELGYRPDAWVGLGAVCLLVCGPWVMRRLQLGAVLMRLWPVAVLALALPGASWVDHFGRCGGVAEACPSVARVGAVSLSFFDLSGLYASGPSWTWSAVPDLVLPVLMLAAVTFASSVAVAQAFALKDGARIDANRELLGLGLANVGSAVLGGLPVAGGLSRSVVNDAAGARSPLAGVISAAVLVAILAVSMPLVALLPKAALAAVIIVAMLDLIRPATLLAAWRYDRAEAGAFVVTALGVLLVGFETGLMLGMAWSLGAMIWRHSQPHLAEVGRMPGTEHFRNVARFDVETLPGVLMLRVDESLNFTNVQRVEQGLCERVHGSGCVDRVVLLLSAVNHIDHTAAQALLELDKALAEQGKTLYLAEVKGPVMDRLQAGGVASQFDGRIYLSAQQAWQALSAKPAALVAGASPVVV